MDTSGGSRISPRRERQFSRGCQHTILPNFPKNCMKLKEFWPPGGASLAPPLRSATGYLPRGSNDNTLCITKTGNAFVARWVVSLVTIPLLDYVMIHSIQWTSFRKNAIGIYTTCFFWPFKSRLLRHEEFLLKNWSCLFLDPKVLFIKYRCLTSSFIASFKSYSHQISVDFVQM